MFHVLGEFYKISHRHFQKNNKICSLAINECPQDVYKIVHDMKISQINNKYRRATAVIYILSNQN